MPRYHVVTLGSGTVDTFLSSQSFRQTKISGAKFSTGEFISLPLGGKTSLDKVTLVSGGGATNTAVTFARQGFITSCLFKTGSDTWRDTILSELKKDKVKVLSPTDQTLATDFSAILIAPSGSRSILNLRSASSTLSLNDLNKQLPKKIDCLYISPGHLPFEVVERAINLAHSAGALIAFNPSREYLSFGLTKLNPLFKKSSVVILNREEAASLTKSPFKNPRLIFTKLDKIIDGLAVMTEGSQGLMVSDGHTLFRAGIFKNQHVVDRTGAGDAFGSGFVAALLPHIKDFRQKSFDQDVITSAIRLGSANATSVVETLGAKDGIITRRDFDNSFRWRSLKVITHQL